MNSRLVDWSADLKVSGFQAARSKVTEENTIALLCLWWPEWWCRDVLLIFVMVRFVTSDQLDMICYMVVDMFCWYLWWSDSCRHVLSPYPKHHELVSYWLLTYHKQVLGVLASMHYLSMAKEKKTLTKNINFCVHASMQKKHLCLSSMH